jgi:hypothetical protein
MNPVNERLGRKRGPTAKAQRIAEIKKCIQLVQECGKPKRRPISKTRRQLLESLKAEGVI